MKKLPNVEPPERGQWSGSPDPKDPDNYWIDDETGERIAAEVNPSIEGGSEVRQHLRTILAKLPRTATK